MATIADVAVTNTAFTNLNLSSGLIAGTPLVIQNKSTSDVYIVISTSAPSTSSENGWLLSPRASILVENESEPVWARATHAGSNKLSVQEYK